MRRLCAVAGAWTLLNVAMTPEAEAQARFRETGTVQAGQYVIWLRGTDAGMVQLFAARGYRDALSRPHALRPEAIDSWLDSVSRLSAAHRAATKEIVVSSNNLSADGTAFERRLGGRLPGVTIRLSNGEIVTMPEVSVSAFGVALAKATRAARELSPVSPAVVASRVTATDGVSSPAAPSPAPVQASVVTVSELPAVTVAAKPATDLLPPPVDVAKPISPPSQVATVAAANPPAVTRQPDKPARPAIAAQVPVTTRAPEPVLAASLPANPLPANSPTENPVPVKPLPVSPVSAAPPLELSPIVPVQVPVKAVLLVSAPVIMVVPVQGPVLADTTLGLPMGDIVIPASILRDRESQAQYCYRELGYRYDSKLSGKLLVRVAIAQNGSVSNVRVVQRNWDGVPASEVESCLRALIRLWTFEAGDPRSAGIKEFSFTFTP